MGGVYASGTGTIKRNSGPVLLTPARIEISKRNKPDYLPRVMQCACLLWTQEEAAAIRKRVETDPAAKRQYDLMVANATGLRRSSVNMTLLNLFKYAVLKDVQAGETEKKALLAFVGKHPPANTPGDPNTGNAQWRDDRTLEALRYDVLQDLLSDQEKVALRKTIDG